MRSRGLQLARGYYVDVVRPLLHAAWPSLPHAAARLGGGSEVLGLDDETSRDHDFGLRLTLLVEHEQVEPVRELLQEKLPESYAGEPVRFATSWDSDPQRHRVDVLTIETLTDRLLGLHPAGEWDAADWLSLTGQSVLEVTAGPVFHDGLGALDGLRRRLHWYPRDVERYVLAADWQRLAQELPFVGRAGHRGDDLGSRVVTGRLVRTVMHLGFLLHRRWAPYPKWFGSCFSQLPNSPRVGAALSAALATDQWRERQAALAAAVEELHALQRSRGLPTDPSPAVEPFHVRPFVVVRDAVAQLLLDDVTDPLVRRLPTGIGAVEQWVDSVDVLIDPVKRRALTSSWRVS